MAAQERIIGGGFLVVGVAIVLVLLYLFTWGGSGPQEAYDQIVGDLFPAYEAAVREDDYIAVKEQARKILEALEEGGETAVRKHIESEAISGRGAGARLHELVKSGALEKAAEGLFGYGGAFYNEKSHRALGRLKEAVETRMKALRGIRETARQARAAIEEARVGSGLALVLPPAKASAPDDAPIVEPNPVYEHDRELYRIFGLEASELSGALAGSDPGGRSTSARLRWNKNVMTSGLKQDIAAIPERADELNSIATQLDLSSKTLSTDPKAARALAQLLKRGARMLGAGMNGPQAARYKEQIAAFRKGTSLVNALRAEARMLAPYLTTVRPLGPVFGKSFR